jgi:hypothetical protein
MVVWLKIELQIGSISAGFCSKTDRLLLAGPIFSEYFAAIPRACKRMCGHLSRTSPPTSRQLLHLPRGQVPGLFGIVLSGSRLRLRTPMRTSPTWPPVRPASGEFSHPRDRDFSGPDSQCCRFRPVDSGIVHQPTRTAVTHTLACGKTYFRRISAENRASDRGMGRQAVGGAQRAGPAGRLRMSFAHAGRGIPGSDPDPAGHHLGGAYAPE